MSRQFLVTLTVVEILLLVLVLAIYLMIVSKQLRSISSTLAKVVFGVRAVEQQVSIGPAVRELNQLIGEIADRDLPAVAQTAERLTGRR